MIEHQVITRWCPCCQQWRSPRLDLQGHGIGHGRFGVRLASLIAYLRTTLRLPVRAIQGYLATLHHLRLSVGTIVGLLHRVRQVRQPVLAALQHQARASPVVHGDETGWRENGQHGFVWSLSTTGPQALRYYAYDHSRRHVVGKRLLGGQVQGVLSRDFYGAYTTYVGPHQRCWVHLLRDRHALKQAHAQDRLVLAWAQAVRALYDVAQRWLQDTAQPTHMARQTQYTALGLQVYALGLQYAQVHGHPCQALGKRCYGMRWSCFSSCWCRE